MNRLTTIVTALCLATGGVAQAETKQEQGFTAGMTEEHLLQQLKDKGAECTSGFIDWHELHHRWGRSRVCLYARHAAPCQGDHQYFRSTASTAGTEPGCQPRGSGAANQSSSPAAAKYARPESHRGRLYRGCCGPRSTGNAGAWHVSCVLAFGADRGNPDLLLQSDSRGGAVRPAIPISVWVPTLGSRNQDHEPPG
jgi:hypothetical protein